MNGQESGSPQASSSLQALRLQKVSSHWEFRDFSLAIRLPAPPDYPTLEESDTFVEIAPPGDSPPRAGLSRCESNIAAGSLNAMRRILSSPEETAWLAGYETRRRAYLEFCTARPAPPILKAPFYELPRAAAGHAVHEGILHAGLDYIESRRDCSDFLAHAYLRIFLSPMLRQAIAPELLQRTGDVLYAFKYWPDEPGIDSLCTWTENHQILYASAALTLGQAAPDRVFGNSGRTGAEQAKRFRPRVLRWLDLRYRTGFSEWLSNVYYDEDLAALITLVDFADEEIASKAAGVADLLFLDLALHTCRGVFGPTHGRSYEDQKKDAGKEAMSDTLKLSFGVGCWCRYDNMSAVCLALSRKYHPPAVCATIISDDISAEIRQRMGIRVDEASRWGLGYDTLEDGMAFLSLEAYNHPKTINLTFGLFDAFNWWSNDYFAPFKRMRGLIRVARALGLMPLVARLMGHDINRNAREETNIYTWRTKDYSLSSAQDWCPGRGGDQQSIWQATLGPGAVCFTTHPGGRGERSPGYWTGSGSLPRVAQYRNVLFALYRIDTRPGLYHTNHLVFTHAWLPAERFDEVRRVGPWTFARRGNAYLALTADRQTLYTRDDGKEGPANELVARGRRTAWVCRLGCEPDDGSFESFIAATSAARLSYSRGRVAFDDPTHGKLEFGWRGPLTVAGQVQSLRDYPRYESPWVKIDFPVGEGSARQ